MKDKLNVYRSNEHGGPPYFYHWYYRTAEAPAVRVGPFDSESEAREHAATK